MTHTPPDDKYARESFGWRRMTSGQLWGVSIFGIAVLLGLLIYSASI